MKTRIQRLYDRHQGVIQIVALFLMPLAIFILGYIVTRSIKDSEREQNYVTIASGILSQKVEDESKQKAIRTWAADILQKYSPIELTDAQRDDLISGRSRLSPPSGYGSDSFYLDDYGYGSDSFMLDDYGSSKNTPEKTK